MIRYDRRPVSLQSTHLADGEGRGCRWLPEALEAIQGQVGVLVGGDRCEDGGGGGGGLGAGSLVGNTRLGVTE